MQGFSASEEKRVMHYIGFEVVFVADNEAVNVRHTHAQANIRILLGDLCRRIKREVNVSYVTGFLGYLSRLRMRPRADGLAMSDGSCDADARQDRICSATPATTFWDRPPGRFHFPEAMGAPRTAARCANAISPAAMMPFERPKAHVTVETLLEGNNNRTFMKGINYHL